MAEMTYRATEIKTGPNIVLDLFRGYDDEPEVRGEDDIIPGLPGRTERNRVKDRRIVELRGYILGTGASLGAQQASYRTSVTTLRGLLDPTASPGSLIVTAPYMGLASGTKTLSARYLSAVWGDIVMMKFRRVSIVLECIANPPEWA